MRHEARAVLFDLDDTLYPYRRFVVSGFAAVAHHLARGARLDERAVFMTLVRASHGADRGRELQTCIERFGLEEKWLSGLVELIRNHEPVLRLPPAAVRVLRALLRGWRLGIVTNGLPHVQANKVRALRVRSLVDTVVYAGLCGTGAGKPDPAPFEEALRRLDVDRSRTVFVGDDARCDI